MVKSQSKSLGLFLQDPSLPELHDDWQFPLDLDYLTSSGSSRFIIHERNMDSIPFHPVLKDQVSSIPVPSVDFSSASDLSFAHFEKHGLIDNIHFHQVNVFAAAHRTLALVEEELGQPIFWTRTGGPLYIRPHAFEGANAFFTRNPATLSFGYFGSPFSRTPIWTCLSHDIISHELGHAILDNLRPFFVYDEDPDTGAFGESFGDWLAAFCAFEHPKMVEHLYRETGGDLRHPSLISRYGEQLGAAALGMNIPYTRSMLNGPTYNNAPRQVHARSAVWSAAMYDIFVELATHAQQNSMSFYDSIVTAARWLRGMLFRTLSYLPPTGLTMPLLARLMVEADARVFPNDSRFRDIAKKIFQERKIWKVEWEHDADRIDLTPPPGIGEELRDARHDVQKLAFVLMKYAEPLYISRKPEHRLLTPRITTTTRRVDRVEVNGKSTVTEITEHYLEYIYERIELRRTSKDSDEEKVVAVYYGGTFVFDENWNAVLLATNPVVETHEDISPEELFARHDRRLTRATRRSPADCPLKHVSDQEGIPRIIQPTCSLIKHITALSSV